MPIIKSINISDNKGTIKHSVPFADIQIDYGIIGDAHAGTWHRQISLLAQESIDKMTALGMEGLIPGIFAENITTEGITLHTLPIGTKLQLGECLAEVTQIGKECHTQCEIRKKTGMCIMPTEGIFVKVLKGGRIYSGDKIIVL